MAKQIFSQEPQEYNKALAEALKKIPEFKTPDWAFFVKSGVSKKRVPEDEDFWYKRAASILRQLYIRGVVGVNRLKTRYGSRKNRGVKPAKFKKASGKMIRIILKQAEQADLVEKVSKRQFGRRLTEKGKQLLDSIKTEGSSGIKVEFVESGNTEKKQEKIIKENTRGEENAK